MGSLTMILLGVISCTLFLQGEAINCWSCSGTSDCADDPNTGGDTVFEAEECTFCTKSKTIQAYGYNSVSRGCISSTTLEDNFSMTESRDEGCITCKDPDNCGTVTEVCFCNGDKCNHSSNILPSMVAILATLGFMKLIL